MNKQLIEIIEKKYGIPFEGYGHTYCIDGVDIIAIAEEYSTSQTEPLKKEIEELKKKTEWISVEDKLPNEFTSVLVVGGDIRSCALYRDKKFYTDFPLPTNEGITHWMPLPEPPKK